MALRLHLFCWLSCLQLHFYQLVWCSGSDIHSKVLARCLVLLLVLGPQVLVLAPQVLVLVRPGTCYNTASNAESKHRCIHITVFSISDTFKFNKNESRNQMDFKYEENAWIWMTFAYALGHTAKWNAFKGFCSKTIRYISLTSSVNPSTVTAMHNCTSHLEPSARRICMLVEGWEASKSCGESLEKLLADGATAAAVARGSGAAAATGWVDTLSATALQWQ